LLEERKGVAAFAWMDLGEDEEEVNFWNWDKGLEFWGHLHFAFWMIGFEKSAMIPAGDFSCWF